MCSILQSSLHGIVAHVDCDMARFLASLLAPLGIPTLIVPVPTSCLLNPMDFSTNNQTTVLLMSPDLSNIHQVLYGILNMNDLYIPINRIAIIYDQRAGE